MHMSENNREEVLPVRNFSDVSDKEAHKISGEQISKERITGFKSCKNCSILCGHHGKFNGAITGVPEYETAALLGSNLGIFDIDKISEWNDLCGELGLDTISTGGTLAFVMEAAEKGLIRSSLQFGNPSGISEMIENIALQKGPGYEFGVGSKRLSEKYGGSEFCMEVKGMEISGYHPGRSLGMGLNYAVANRGGCHLSSSILGMEIVLGYLKPYTILKKAVYVEFLENIFSAINSLHTCQFTIYPYVLEAVRLRYLPTPLIKFFLRFLPLLAKYFFDLNIYSGLFSSVTGIRISAGEFLSAGKRAHILERYMNTREGISAEDDTLPERILSGWTNSSGKSGYPLKKMLRKYYRIRKYDSNGIPEESNLKKLGIRKGGGNRT